MAQVVDARCPRCGAPLPLHPGLVTVTCQYCGLQSLIDRGKKPTTAPSPGGIPVVRVAPPAAAMAVALGVSGAAVVLGVVGAVFFLRPPSTSNSRPGSTPLFGAAPSFYFSDRPMLADVNGDGSPDLLGKSSLPAGDAWLAAYDGRNGKQLWKSATITKDAANYDAVRAVVLDRLISIDGLGKAQAYDVRTGTPSWSALLGEKAKRVCQGDGVIVVHTVDGATQGLDPTSGKKRELAKGAPCKPVPSSDKEQAPGYQIIGWSDFDDFDLPALHALDGLSAHRALVPEGPGPRFMLGARAKGTQIAMVAAVEKKRVLWKDVVPGVDPLTTGVNVTTQEAAYINGRLVIPYNMKEHNDGTRLACFEAATGKRLWDVQVHKKSQVSSGISVSASDVFFASWTAAYVLSLNTGQLRYMIGKEF